MHNAPLNWHAVCGVEDIDEEDLIDFEHDGKPYAVYHTRSGFYATDWENKKGGRVYTKDKRN